MPDHRRVRCRICKRHRDECGSISWRGKCPPCGRKRLSDALDDLHYHRGPVFERWRHRLAASVGAIPLDLLEAGDDDAGDAG